MWTKTPPKDLQIVWHEFAVDYFKDKGIGSIIDIGSGWGKAKERLQKITPNVKTQDINRALMEIVDYVCYTKDIEDVFDLVTVFDVIEHVPDTELDMFLIDLHLMNDGHLFFTTPNRLFFEDKRPWRYSPIEFVELFNKSTNNYDLNYFLRFKTGNSDKIHQVDKKDFIEKNSYGMGIHLQVKDD